MQNKIKILNVTDGNNQLDPLLSSLTQNGYSFNMAKNQKSVIEKLQKESFHFTIIDSQSIETGTLELLKTIKKIQPHTQVIILTQFSSHETISQYIKEGALDCLYKPIKIEELKKVIDSTLDPIEKTGKMFKEKILVVDDDKNVRDSSSILLQQEGFDVQKAADGYEAIEKIKKGFYNLVLTDIKMPGISGLELMHEIKKIAPETIVILMTGFATLDSAIEAIREDAHDFITKPFNIKNLIASVNKALDIQRLSNENKRLYEQTQKDKIKLRKRAYELSVLNDFSNTINKAFNYKTLMNFVIDSVYKIIECDICATLLLESNPELNIFANHSLNKKKIDEIKMIILEDIPNTTPSIIDKISTHFEKVQKDDLVKPKEKIKTYLNIPLIIENKKIGAIFVGSINKEVFPPIERQLLCTITNQTSQAIVRIKNIISEEKIKMDAMVASMSNGVILTDVDNNILVINSAAKKMLLLKRESDIIDIDFLKKNRNFHLDNYISEKKESKKEVLTKEVYIKEPKESVLNIDLTPIKNINNKIIGHITVLRDITELKEIDRMKTEFVSIVSHEMRTPLTSIKNCINIILTEATGKINENQKKFLSMASDSTNRMARLINDLLDLSKMESGRMEYHFEKIDLNSILESVITSLQTQITTKNIHITKKIAANLPKIYADSGKITQVITNILDNALKFTPSQKNIQVGVRKMQGENLTVKNTTFNLPVSVFKQDSFVEINIKDSGSGITAQDMDKIFDKFQQVEDSLKREVGGTGLGLPIAKSIVNAHNGQIWVESKEGQGSNFRFILPINKRKKLDSKES